MSRLSMTRDEAELALPFYVNGTLDEPERSALALWLADDAELAFEAQSLQVMRHEMRAGAPRGHASENGLARLMAAVDAEPREARSQLNSWPDTSARAAPAAANSPARPWLWQAAAAVALLALVGQTAFYAREQSPAGFEMASGEAIVAAAPASAGPIITLGFAPQTQEAEIRALLLELGLEITSGPSALGLYRLIGADAARIDDVMTALRANPVVETVEYDAE